jgi:methionyl-tRNA formyltransferase
MKKIIFMGTPDFAVPILGHLMKSEYEVVLVVTQPDRPKGRRRELTASPVKEAAVDYGLPVFQPEKLTDTYEEMFSYGADLIVTAAYGQLLPKALLEYPPDGCINVHASLLPALRGGAPIHYAILQGEKETGITIMYMAEKLDAGDILTQQSIPIKKTDHVGILHETLSQVGANLLMKTLPKLFNNELKPEKQDESKATYAPNITREQERIDWHQTHEEVYNHIRGLHPWPVAYAVYEGSRLKIWWAQTDDQLYSDRKPGEIGRIAEDAIIVVCGDLKGIRMTDLQLAGKKRMKVAEFLRGNPEQFQIGQMLE